METNEILKAKLKEERNRVEYLERLILDLTELYEWGDMRHNGMCGWPCSYCEFIEEIEAVAKEAKER